MKLNSCTTIELKDRRLECLEELVRLADEMGQIDAIVIDREKENCLKESVLTDLSDDGIQKIPRATVERNQCSC